jgi:hypothetical protein
MSVAARSPCSRVAFAETWPSRKNSANGATGARYPAAAATR